MTVNMTDVISTVISMFIVMAIGYAARKFKLMDGDLSKKLSEFILHIAQPFMIFSAIVKISYTSENAKQGGLVLLIGICVHAFLALVAFLFMIFIKNPDKRKMSEYSVIFANCMFFGMPLIKQIFGPEGEFWLSFFVITFNLFIWTYGLFILGRGRDDIKLDPLKIILNYGTIPCILGIAFFFMRVTFPAPVMTAMTYIGNMCTPISLLITGSLLATIPLKKLFTSLTVYYTCLIKLIVVPLIVFFIVRLVGLDARMSLFAMIMAGLPTATNTTMFAEIYDIEPGYAAQTVGIMTVLAIGSLPLLVYIANLFA